MKEKFDWEGTTYQAEMILEGNHSNNKIDSVSSMLLANMKQALPEEKDNAFITEDQFGGKVKAWRESTSTSPSSG